MLHNVVVRYYDRYTIMNGFGHHKVMMFDDVLAALLLMMEKSSEKE